jgi:hypothetical protein
MENRISFKLFQSSRREGAAPRVTSRPALDVFRSDGDADEEPTLPLESQDDTMTDPAEARNMAFSEPTMGSAAGAFEKYRSSGCEHAETGDMSVRECASRYCPIFAFSLTVSILPGGDCGLE